MYLFSFVTTKNFKDFLWNDVSLHIYIILKSGPSVENTGIFLSTEIYY